MGVPRKCFPNFWSPSGWSGRLRMSKKWGFGGFWVSLWGFCHHSPTYEIFLETLGQCECPGSVSKIFGHHQDDQEGQECPKSGDLEDSGYLDGDFVIIAPHMIQFWKPWDHGSAQEVFPNISVIFRMIRKLKNVKKWVFGGFLVSWWGFCQSCVTYIWFKCRVVNSNK